MDPSDIERRATIARRLKAARWLAGGIQATTKGKVRFQVTAMSPDDLAAKDLVGENGITPTLIGAIERMERHTPPMELHAIADALDLPRWWFEVDWSRLPDLALPRIEGTEERFDALGALEGMRDAIEDVIARVKALPPGAGQTDLMTPLPAEELERELTDAAQHTDMPGDSTGEVGPSRGGQRAQR